MCLFGGLLCYNNKNPTSWDRDFAHQNFTRRMNGNFSAGKRFMRCKQTPPHPSSLSLQNNIVS